MAVTLRDVAVLARVSVKTVSNVVHGYEFVKPATRARVLSAIERLGYQPNLAARNLRAGRTGMIGLAVPELSFSYFAELADAVLAAARARHYVVLIEQTGGERQEEIELLRGPRTSMLDGLLFSPLGMSSADVSMLDVDYPLVLLGERVFDPQKDHVAIQNVEGARAATEHLIRNGCRRIAVLGAHPSESIGSAPLRLEGYRRALADHDIDFVEELVVNREGWHRNDGAEATQELLQRAQPFDAIFALNDELAMGALRALHQEGLQVPDQVMVMGFDNVVEGQFALPSLSTIDPRRGEIAERAVSLLIDRIVEPDIGVLPPRLVEVPYALVTRETAPDSSLVTQA
jgi:DNA-binding LacI/PurR family transcriptional regulator